MSHEVVNFHIIDCEVSPTRFTTIFNSKNVTNKSTLKCKFKCEQVARMNVCFRFQSSANAMRRDYPNSKYTLSIEDNTFMFSLDDTVILKYIVREAIDTELKFPTQ